MIDNISNFCFLTPQLQFQMSAVQLNHWYPFDILKMIHTYMKISGKLTQEEKPVVTVVLDALDECDNPGARSNFLTVLAGQTVTLASSLHFEFVITSRTEPDICSESFKIHHGSHVRRHELDTISDANTTHILLYFQHRASLTRIRNRYLRLSGDWPGEGILQKLIERACGHFDWVATA